MTETFTPSIPYGTKGSGWSGSETSEEAEPHRRARQEDVLKLLMKAGAYGLTSAEVEQELGVHHGVASSALSCMHKVNQIARLTAKRGRYKVYVAPLYVNGRPVEVQGRHRKAEASEAPRETPESTRVAVARAEGALITELTSWFIKGGANNAAAAVEKWYLNRKV